MWISKATTLLITVNSIRKGSGFISSFSSLSVSPKSRRIQHTIAKTQSTRHNNIMKKMSSNNDNKSMDTLSSKYTPIESIQSIVEEAHQIYSTQITRPYQWRMDQLKAIERLVSENRDELAAAIAKDLGQGEMYVDMFELTHIITWTQFAQSNLKEWMATTRIPTPWPVNLNIPIHSELTPNPRGVALIITPWNLPIQLTLHPLIDAIAAGNVCVLKMSERSPHSTVLLTDLIGKYLDPRAVKVINGEAAEATELLKQRFDVMSYTGSTTIGRIVAKAAAKQLTPVLLEMGGKNPVFISNKAHIPSAAKRIAWGKVTANTGQMCICPDYVLVEESIKTEFINQLCSEMDQLYPVSSYTNGVFGDVGKMISVQQAERVIGLLDDSTCDIIYGGKHHNFEERFVAPTIVEATIDSKVMKEEIFGPILAIITIPNLESGIEFVNRHFTSKAEHPLALYIFSKSKEEQQKIKEAVPSGMCAINEVVKQSANYHAPFGGVGASGMGAYYGKTGFDFFSHNRPTLVGSNYSTLKFDPSVWLANPPFNDRKLKLFRIVGKVPTLFTKLKTLAKVAIPIAFVLTCFSNPSFVDTLLELNIKTIFTWISQIADL